MSDAVSESSISFDITKFCLKRRIVSRFGSKQQLLLRDQDANQGRRGLDGRPATLEVDHDAKTSETSSAVSSRGLLSYFDFLQKDVNTKDEIDIYFVVSLVENGADINAKDKYGQTGAHVVARDWHPDVASCFIILGMDFTVADLYGRTPMHVAAATDYSEMIELLHENEVPIDVVTNDEQQTPMHFAAKYDAANAMKTLLKHGMDIDCRDAMNRSPLFIAAESGRVLVVKLLLQLGAPASNFDKHGRSAVSLLADKVPQLATMALDQFIAYDPVSGLNSIYANQLEAKPNTMGMKEAMSVLEVVVQYHDQSIIVHPTLRYLTGVKWIQFARTRALLNLVVYFIYALVITALGVTMTRSDSLYSDSKAAKFVRIIAEIFVILMTFSFAVQELISTQRHRKIHSDYRTWALRRLRTELKHCHPCWKEGKLNCLSDIDRMQQPSERSIDMWLLYDCAYWLVFGVLVVCHVVLLVNWIDQVRRVYRYVFCFLILLAWMRILKLCRGFTYLGTMISLLGHVSNGLWKLALLFIVLFVPYTCSVWVLFGGKVNAAKMTAQGLEGFKFERPGDIIFYMWMLIFEWEIPITEMIKYNRMAAYILIGTYLAFATIVCINLNIAVLTEAFTRLSETTTASALLQQATLAIDAEYSTRQRGLNQRRVKDGGEQPQMTKAYFEVSSYGSMDTSSFLKEVAGLLSSIPEQSSAKSVGMDVSSDLIEILEKNLKNLLDACEKMAVKAEMTVKETRTKHSQLIGQLEEAKGANQYNSSVRPSNMPNRRLSRASSLSSLRV